MRALILALSLGLFGCASVEGAPSALSTPPAVDAPSDYPIAWCKNYGKGRVFYTSLGHREDVWCPTWKDAKGERKNSNTGCRGLSAAILGGIQWALGLERWRSRPQKAAAK